MKRQPIASRTASANGNLVLVVPGGVAGPSSSSHRGAALLGPPTAVPSRTISRIYDTGGGSGPGSDFSLETQQRAQLEMYKRTFSATPMELANLEQERRQTSIIEKKVKMVINVAREDFPSNAKDIEICYPVSAPQSEWQNMLSKIRQSLNLEFIEDIIDRMDNAVVHRILRMRNGGKYFVRQRETSAVLEVLYTGITPEQISWPATKGITQAKDHLATEEVALPRMDRRVDELIDRPMTRLHQVEAVQYMLEAKDPQNVLDAIEDIMYSEYAMDPVLYEKNKAEEAKLNAAAETRTRSQRKGRRKDKEKPVEGAAETLLEMLKKKRRENRTHDKQVDVVSVYRVGLESVTRILKSHAHPLEISPLCLQYALEVYREYPEEQDLVVFVLKLLSELVPYVLESKDRLLGVALDVIGRNAPEAPGHRPRPRPKRIAQLTPADDSTAIERELTNTNSTENDDSSQPLTVKERALAAMANASSSSKLLGSRRDRGTLAARDLNSVNGGDDLLTASNSLVESMSTEAADKEGSFVLASEGSTSKQTPSEESLAEEANAKRWSGTRGGIGRKVKKKTFESMWAVGGHDEEKPFDPRAALTAAMRSSGSQSLLGRSTSVRTLTRSASMSQSAILRSSGLATTQVDKIPEDLLAELINVHKPPAQGEFHHLEARTVAPRFRGFAATMKKQNLLLQGIACIYKAASFHFAYRDAMFNLYAHDELSHVAHSCQSVPRVLEYYIWIINAMYSDGFDDSEDQEVESDAVTMQVSQLSIDDPSGVLNGGDSVSGMVIDAVSTITLPTIDPQYVNLEKAPKPNFGNPNKKLLPDAKVFPDPSKVDPNINNETDIALDPLKNREGPSAGGGIRSSIGDHVFTQRYQQRPSDEVVLGVMLVASHYEIEVSEKAMANRWITHWDDCSVEFKMLIRKGREMGSI